MQHHRLYLRQDGNKFVLDLFIAESQRLTTQSGDGRFGHLVTGANTQPLMGATIDLDGEIDKGEVEIDNKL